MVWQAQSVRPIWLALPFVLACDPERVDYAIDVKNEYPGTRIGIFSDGSKVPLATTTHASETLQVQAGFKEHLTGRFVDVPNARTLDLSAVTPDQLRASAKEHRPLARTLRVSRVVVEGGNMADVEVVLASPTDEALTIDGVPVDTKAVPPGTRLVVPAAPGSTVAVKFGATPPVSIDLGYMRRGDVGPAGFVYLDPTGSACVQTRAIVYGAGHLIPGSKDDNAPTRRAPAKVHAFGRTTAPSIIFGEHAPTSVAGSVLATRTVLEQCSAVAKK